METFTVYRTDEDRFDAVKEGFNWPAFFFPYIWPFTVGLYWIGGIVLGAWLIDRFVIGPLFMATRDAYALGGSPVALAGSLVTFVILLAAAFWLGFDGNRLRGRHLERRGYQVVEEGVQGRRRGEIILARLQAARAEGTAGATVTDPGRSGGHFTSEDIVENPDGSFTVAGRTFRALQSAENYLDLRNRSIAALV